MNPNIERIHEVIAHWLSARLNAESLAWIDDRQKMIRSGDKKALYLAFGMTPRKVGKADLALSADEVWAAASARPGWNALGWSIDQAVRTSFALCLPSIDPTTYVMTLDQLFSTGEVGELVALYQSLPLLPHPSANILRAAEGVRTNIKAVFCAVAHQNPFPAEQFDEDQWNQMVLKCQFIGVPMSPIIGLDERANARLSAMVIDFIHERWAAKRSVAPDMWRCVGRFADDVGLADLKQVLKTGSPVEQQAAALAISESPSPAAAAILSTAPGLAQQIAEGKISWSIIDATPSNEDREVIQRLPS